VKGTIGFALKLMVEMVRRDGLVNESMDMPAIPTVDEGDTIKV
jgi:hypothetical protein